MGAEILATPLVIIVASGALGALGVYLMLPGGHEDPRRTLYWLGVALFGIPVMLLGFWLLGTSAAQVVFSILACVSLAAAVMTVTSRTATSAVLSFSLMLFSNSGLYLIGNARFVSLVTVVVYIGVIGTSFLFVARLIEIRGKSRSDRDSCEPLLACATGAMLAVTLVAVIQYALSAEANPQTAATQLSALPKRTTVEAFLKQAPARMRIDRHEPHVASLARTLFRDHFVAIEVAALLMVVAVVTHVAIIRRSGDDGRAKKVTVSRCEKSDQLTERDAGAPGL